MQNSPELNGKFLGTITSDFVKVCEQLKEASYAIQSRGFSEKPIFVFCKENQPIGQMLIKKEEANIAWNISASFLEEFTQRNLVTEMDQFNATFKNPEEFCALFVVDPEFTNFVYLPYPEDA